MLTRAISLIALAPAVAVAFASPIGSDVKTGACFYRFEDGGALNIREATVVIDEKESGLITGGMFLCIALSPGTHNVQVTSTNPYDPADRNQPAWRSKSLSFRVQNEQKVFVRVWPGSSEAGYTGLWHLAVTSAAPNVEEFP